MLTALGRKLFFAADDGAHGQELWKSNGKKGGTGLVRNIRSGDKGKLTPSSLSAASGKLYFAADDKTHGTELWKSNGKKGGTALVKDIKPGKADALPRT